MRPPVLCRRYSSRCRAVGCRAISSAPIHGAAKGSSTRDARKRERRKWPADDVDEYGCSTIGAGQISFKNIDVESKPVTLKFRGLQHDHGVADCRTILAERRYRCVRGVFCKVVGPHRPIFNDVARGVVPCRTNRPVSENDRVWCHPGQHKFISLQADALRVEDNQGGNDLWLGHASDSFLQWHMWRSGRGSLGECYPRRAKHTDDCHDNKGNACHVIVLLLFLWVSSTETYGRRNFRRMSPNNAPHGPLSGLSQV